MEVLSRDERFMKEALIEAQKAEEKGEVPIGCVIVQDDQIIARGYNLREISQDATTHAEMRAIREANAKMKSWRLPEAELYVTIEPCAMCSGAILLSRIKRVVYGAPDKKGGMAGTVLNLFDQPALNHHPEVIGGVLEQEAANQLSQFFSKLREEKKKRKLAIKQDPMI